MGFKILKQLHTTHLSDRTENVVIVAERNGISPGFPRWARVSVAHLNLELKEVRPMSTDRAAGTGRVSGPT